MEKPSQRFPGSSISPGAIDTPMTRSETTSADLARLMIEPAAIPRMGRPDDVAAVAAFLCSPAASFVTSCDVLVDGGHTTAIGW